MSLGSEKISLQRSSSRRRSLSSKQSLPVSFLVEVDVDQDRIVAGACPLSSTHRSKYPTRSSSKTQAVPTSRESSPPTCRKVSSPYRKRSPSLACRNPDASPSSARKNGVAGSPTKNRRRGSPASSPFRSRVKSSALRNNGVPTSPLRSGPKSSSSPTKNREKVSVSPSRIHLGKASPPVPIRAAKRFRSVALVDGADRDHKSSSTTDRGRGKYNGRPEAEVEGAHSGGPRRPRETQEDAEGDEVTEIVDVKPPKEGDVQTSRKTADEEHPLTRKPSGSPDQLEGKGRVETVLIDLSVEEEASVDIFEPRSSRLSSPSVSDPTSPQTQGGISARRRTKPLISGLDNSTPGSDILGSREVKSLEASLTRPSSTSPPLNCSPKSTEDTGKRNSNPEFKSGLCKGKKEDSPRSERELIRSPNREKTEAFRDDGDFQIEKAKAGAESLQRLSPRSATSDGIGARRRERSHRLRSTGIFLKSNEAAPQRERRSREKGGSKEEERTVGKIHQKRRKGEAEREDVVVIEDDEEDEETATKEKREEAVRKIVDRVKAATPPPPDGDHSIEILGMDGPSDSRRSSTAVTMHQRKWKRSVESIGNWMITKCPLDMMVGSVEEEDLNMSNDVILFNSTSAHTPVDAPHHHQSHQQPQQHPHHFTVANARKRKSHERSGVVVGCRCPGDGGGDGFLDSFFNDQNLKRLRLSDDSGSASLTPSPVQSSACPRHNLGPLPSPESKLAAARVGHLIFVDLNAWGAEFFCSLPEGAFPGATFVYAFRSGTGGAVTAVPSALREAPAFDGLLRRERLMFHQEPVVTHRGADLSLCYQAGRLDVLLDASIRFTILAGTSPAGLAELRKQFAFTSARKRRDVIIFDLKSFEKPDLLARVMVPAPQFEAKSPKSQEDPQPIVIDP